MSEFLNVVIALFFGGIIIVLMGVCSAILVDSVEDGKPEWFLVLPEVIFWLALSFVIYRG